MGTGHRKMADGKICAVCRYVTSVGYSEHLIIYFNVMHPEKMITSYLALKL